MSINIGPPQVDELKPRIAVIGVGGAGGVGGGPVLRLVGILMIAISEQTYYRWRKEYGGLKTDQARRMKDLEKENARLRRAISDLTLDKLILQEAARGNF